MKTNTSNAEQQERVRCSAWLGRFVRTHAWAFALGASLGVIGVNCYEWRYRAVFVPTLIGVLLRPNK